MQVRLKDQLVVVTAESEEEKALLVAWAAARDNHVFVLKHQDSQTFRLTDLGPRSTACNEPINISSRAPDPAIQLISNLAHTPFELHGMAYASVEGFWQGLKFADQKQRREIALLHGQAARHAGFNAETATILEYGGRQVHVGTAEHWQLMSAACWAKFTAHELAKQALIGTGNRPLQHKTRRDSLNIPGVIMADIWMKIRQKLIQASHTENIDAKPGPPISDPNTG